MIRIILQGESIEINTLDDINPITQRAHDLIAEDIPVELHVEGVDSALLTAQAAILWMERQAMESKIYRAAYWVDDERQHGVVLTAPEHADRSDDELLTEARAEAERVGLDLSTGELLIGYWDWDWDWKGYAPGDRRGAGARSEVGR